MELRPYGDYPDHEARRRRAHVAEIAHTPDWDRIMRDSEAYPGSPESIEDGKFAGLKASFTGRAGRRTAPWNMREAEAENIAERIQQEGTIAWAAYHGVDAPADAPRPITGQDRLESMSPEERAALDEKIARRRRER